MTGRMVFPGTLYLVLYFLRPHFCLDQHTDLFLAADKTHVFSKGKKEAAVLRGEKMFYLFYKRSIFSLLEHPIFRTELNLFSKEIISVD